MLPISKVSLNRLIYQRRDLRSGAFCSWKLTNLRRSSARGAPGCLSADRARWLPRRTAGNCWALQPRSWLLSFLLKAAAAATSLTLGAVPALYWTADWTVSCFEGHPGNDFAWRSQARTFEPRLCPSAGELATASGDGCHLVFIRGKLSIRVSKLEAAFQNAYLDLCDQELVN